MAGPYNGNYRPRSPFFVFSFGNTVAAMLLVACIALLLGLLVRAIMVFSQPAPTWSANNCVATETYSKGNDVYVSVDCGEGRGLTYSLYSLSQADIGLIMSPGRSASCSQRPAVWTWLVGDTVTECSMNPETSTVSDQ